MRRISIIFTIILLAGFGLISSVQAQTASLYLAPSSGSFLTGSTFSVSVFVNTEGNEINAVSAEITFPPEILQITSPAAGTSFITEWITPPNYSNEKGIISFRGGIPWGIKTSAGLVSTITFRTVASGKAKISFGKNSRILLNDGKGTDILTTIINGEYNIIIPPPEGPIVFSPTHPEPNVWYSDANPSFSWEKEAGISDFSWSIDQNPNGRPDSIGEGLQNITSFTDLDD
ncbi:MAG: cohesin domain-containing protein [Candidatus Parcubacteria bacterium]|nr:cohesin domain-containing protein [Candidatus Parcubacteria bacterium]